MKFIGIAINCLCAGILLGKRYGKSNHLLLAEAGSCGWLLRIHQAAEGQCVEAWTKLRVLSYSIQLHCNFKDRKNNDDSSQHKTSTSIHSDYYCHFLDCQLASAFAVKCRFLYLQAPLPRDLGAITLDNNFQTSKCPWWGGVLCLFGFPVYPFTRIVPFRPLCEKSYYLFHRV